MSLLHQLPESGEGETDPPSIDPLYVSPRQENVFCVCVCVCVYYVVQSEMIDVGTYQGLGI